MQLTNYSVNYSNIRKQTSEGTYATATKGNAVFTFTDIETETKHKLNLTNANYSTIILGDLNSLIDYYLEEEHKNDNDTIITVAKYTSTDNNYKYTITISGGSKTISIPTYSYEFYEIT